MIELSELEAKRDARWQERQRPFMTATIIILGCFFFFATLWQLITLQERIVEQRPEWMSSSTASAIQDDRLRVLSKLESEVISRRHHLASTLLAGRVWQLYLGFVTGMILSLVGAVFILGKLRESESTASVESASVKASLKSSSPGIVLAVLGVILMVTTIVTNHKIEVEDRPQYLMEMPTTQRGSGEEAKPVLPNLPNSDRSGSRNNTESSNDPTNPPALPKH